MVVRVGWRASLTNLVFRSPLGHQRRFDVGGTSAIAPIATKMSASRRTSKGANNGREQMRQIRAARGRIRDLQFACQIPSTYAGSIKNRQGGVRVTKKIVEPLNCLVMCSHDLPPRQKISCLALVTNIIGQLGSARKVGPLRLKGRRWRPAMAALFVCSRGARPRFVPTLATSLFHATLEI